MVVYVGPSGLIYPTKNALIIWPAEPQAQNPCRAFGETQISTCKSCMEKGLEFRVYRGKNLGKDLTK